MRSNYFDDNNTIYQQPNSTIQPCPITYNFFRGGSTIYQELNLLEYNFSDNNYDICTNLTLSMSKNTSTIDIGSGSNANFYHI
jgi:hypothetical protein